MQKFCPLECIMKGKVTAERIALIILNKDAKTDDPDPAFMSLWKKSAFRACADGGANFIYDLQHSSRRGYSTLGDNCIPDLVSGDFDSIRPEVKEYYERQSKTSVVHTPDQDETDFTKCIRLISEKIIQKEIDVSTIIALAGRQDRFDHTMANINTLYQAQKIVPEGTRTCLLYGVSYVCVLREGKTKMQVDTGLEGSWCGLIPLGQPVVATTKGLKWNLDRDKLEFGGLFSSSNELDGSKYVTVETNHPLVWTLAVNNVE